jgi:hypothetical protein
MPKKENEKEVKLVKKYNMVKMGLPDCTFIKYQYGDFTITAQTSRDTGEYPIISATTEMKDISIDKVEQAPPVCNIRALLCSDQDVKNFRSTFDDACDLMKLMQEDHFKP